jgi:hypothetical protein
MNQSLHHLGGGGGPGVWGLPDCGGGAAVRARGARGWPDGGGPSAWGAAGGGGRPGPWEKAAWQWRRGSGDRWWLPAERVGKTARGRRRGGGSGGARGRRRRGGSTVAAAVAAGRVGEDGTAVATLGEDGTASVDVRVKGEGEEGGRQRYIFNVFIECPRSGTRQRFF